MGITPGFSPTLALSIGSSRIKSIVLTHKIMSWTPLHDNQRLAIIVVPLTVIISKIETMYAALRFTGRIMS